MPPRPRSAAVSRGLTTGTPEVAAELRERVAKTRFKISVGCITQVFGVDAIVNSGNEHLVGTQLPYVNLDGSGGCIFDCVDRAVHRVAGPELHEACMALPIVEGTHSENWGGIRCPVGEARVTPAFGLPHCEYVVHTVGPAWPGSGEELREVYQACVRAALKLEGRGSPRGQEDQRQQLVRSLAVPAISGGIHQWPRDMSWAAAVQALGEHLLEAELDKCRSDGALQPRLRAVVLAAWDESSREEAQECIERWAEGSLTEDGLL